MKISTMMIMMRMMMTVIMLVLSQPCAEDQSNASEQTHCFVTPSNSCR